MNRRDLLRNIAAGTVTLFVVPTVFTSCEEEDPDPGNSNPDEEPLTIDLSDAQNSSLISDGGYKIVGDIIIVNTGSRLYRTFQFMYP